MAVKTIQSVQNTLEVLEVLAAQQPVGVSTLSRRTELDKNAVQRILVTLGDAGWIRQVDSGEWTITSKALQVGTHYTQGLHEVAHPHLAQLQKDTDETVLLFAHEGQTMVVLDCVDSTQALRMTVPIGMVVPMRRSAALDAFLSESERSQLPDAVPAPAEAQFDIVRRDGYFVIDELYENAIAAGAPIMNARGVPIATVTVVGPKVRISKSEARALGARVARTAAAITAASTGVRP